MNHLSQFSRFLRPAKALFDDRGGNVAILFALSVLPLIGFVGAAVDYSRANNARTAMQAALDSTSLMLSKDAAILNPNQLTTKANEYFRAIYKHSEAENLVVTASYTYNPVGPQVIDMSSSATVPTEFMRILGHEYIPISTTTSATWGSTRMRVALALDVTLSMDQHDKIAELRTAAKSLITQLETLAKDERDIFVSIVPFNKDVNVGAENYTADWIRWDGSWGSGVSGGASDTKAPWNEHNGVCRNKSNNNVNNSYKTRSSCEQSSNRRWDVNSRSTWNGCVTDRNQDYDTSNTLPATGTPNTLFWAEQYVANDGCPAALMPLSNKWEELRDKIDELTPAGTTNQPIGLAWAWQTLSDGPFVYPPHDPGHEYSKHIVLMSDGLNTNNRWRQFSQNKSTAEAIDARQATLCSNIKAQGITVYTIQVNTTNDPVQTVMRNCASSADKAFYITSADQMTNVFTQIGNQLAQLRLSK